MGTSGRLSWGILGTARINRAIIPAIRAASRSSLAAVASRDLARAEAYAREWEIPRVFGSYGAILADATIDAVYIPLPNHLHVEWTIAAVRAGKHVLCEKPLALHPRDVDRVARAADDAKVTVAEAFMYRHHPQTRRVQALVADGAIGTLRLVRGSFTFPLTREGDVRLRPEWGGGSLWDVGCYPVSYARLLAGGDPETVVGQAEHGPTGIDIAFTGALQYTSGLLGTFDSGFAAAFRTSIEVVGSEASLVVPNPFKPGVREQLHLVREGTVSTIDVEGEMLYLGEVEDIERVVLDGAAPTIPLTDTRGVVGTLAALHVSAERGTRVRPAAVETL
jgi:D-xylose 1-dehydrogenase (NADP+, D-xylono-1,5-lactone-forming)